jgi:hypothetical protein
MAVGNFFGDFMLYAKLTRHLSCSYHFFGTLFSCFSFSHGQHGAELKSETEYPPVIDFVGYE